MHTFAKPLLTLALAGLVGAAFAGCLSNAPKTNGETTISRVYTVDTDAKTLSSLGDSQTPADAMRQLLKTDLVVRVADAGAYTLSYTDAQGLARTVPLADLVPGTPRVVSGADPMAPATLKDATGEVKATRGPLNATWWHAGDVPLGFTLAPGASASYATSSLVHEGVTLTNVKAEDNVTIDRATVAFTLPVEGSFAYTLGAPEGSDGAPLATTLDLHLPANSADLLLVDATGSMDGKPGTAGVDVSAATARVKLGATTWWNEGGPTASRFDGGEAAFQPTVTGWVTGGFVPDGNADASNCIGKARADNCHPSDLNGTTQTWPAEDKQPIPASDLPRSTTQEERDMVTFLKALFALDMKPGDALHVSVRDSSAEGGNAFDLLETSSLEVVGQEKVDVPAGSFDALKVVQETRVVTNVDSYAGPAPAQSLPSCPPPEPGSPSAPCAEPVAQTSDSSPSIENLHLNETVARSTYWFDAKTYQPVKMETSLPFDVDAAVKAVIRAVQPGAWKTASLQTLSPDQVKLELTATATLQATKLADAPTLVSPVVALGLAQALAAGAAYAPAGYAASLSGLSPSEFMPVNSEPAMPTYEPPTPEEPTSYYG